MRKPRANRTRKHTTHAKAWGTWSTVCRNCKAKFRIIQGPKPNNCIYCKSKKLDVKRSRMNAEEKTAHDKWLEMQFIRGVTGFVNLLMDMFGIGPETFSNHPRPHAVTMDRHEAALFLATHSVIPKDYILDSAEVRDKAYRIAARKLHPDTGGSHELFVKLQEAKEALAI